MDELHKKPELIDEIALIYFRKWLSSQSFDTESGKGITPEKAAYKFVEIRKKILEIPRSR
jgi:hypothetical protein